MEEKIRIYNEKNEIEEFQIKEILESLKKQEANSVIRGFYYQALVTIREWIDCNRKSEIYKVYCEVEDDIKIESENYIKYIQVKCYGKPLSLKSLEVLKSIFTFLQLYLVKKKKNLRFVLESNTEPRKGVLKNWLSKKISDSEIEEIRNELIENFSEKIETNISYKQIINNRDEFKKFIKFIKVKFDSIEVKNAIQSIKNKILEGIECSNIELDKKNYKNLFAILLKEVMDKSSKQRKEERVLDKNIFEICLKKSRYESEEYKLYKEVLYGQEKLQNGQLELHNEHKQILEEIRNISKDANKVNIIVTSRNNIKEDGYILNLKQFFEFGNGKESYRKIKEEDLWNNELMEKIDNFFDNIIKTQSDKKKVIELKQLHYSIAFYIGHEYGKALDDAYLKRGEATYKIEGNNQECDCKIVCEKDILGKQKDVAVIINTSRNSESVKKQVEKFIYKKV